MRCAVADAADAVLDKAVMMRGRMVHFLDGSQQLQRYGRDDTEVIWSVTAANLNIALIEPPKPPARGCISTAACDRRTSTRAWRGSSTIATARCTRTRSPRCRRRRRRAPHCASELGGRSTSASASNRSAMATRNWKSRPADGGFRIEPNALHIWPRGRYMCIALPNDERTFTVTLFLPE